MRSNWIQLRQTATRRSGLALCGSLLALAMLPLFAPVASAAPASLPTESPATTQPQPRYNKAAILPITDEINDVTLESLKRRVQLAQQDGADLLVFQLDTPGGQVISTLKICKWIKGLPQHTVAWVNTEAYSAGAILSLACNEIVMARRSTIGDAMPIMIGTEGPAAVPDSLKPKAVSPMLEEVRDSARRNGYDILLCESLIVPNREVFWLRNSRTGDKRFVNRTERDQILGISATQPEGSVSRTDWQYVTSAPQMPEVNQPIVSTSELLTMSQDEAIAYGFARPTMISNAAELQQYYNLSAAPPRLEYNWSESLVAWLTSPIVRGALLLLTLLGGYIELNHPGVILPGVVALVCLALFLGAPYLTGLANIWAIVLVIAGLILLLLEIFVIPSFGVVGIVGIAVLLVGLVATFVPAEWPGQSPLHLPASQYAWTALRNGLLATVVAMVGSIVGIIVLSRHFRRMPYLNRLVLANPNQQQVSLEDWFADLPQQGQTGVTIGALRPAGKARFGTKLADVVAESDFIEAGQPVQVSQRVGNRVVVRKVSNRSGSTTV